MRANRRIVQQREDGRWEVKAPRADRASAITDTQSAAIDRARDILGNDGGGELTVKGTNGKIRDSDTVAPGNCQLEPNTDQKNTDGDSMGDACDVCFDTYQNPNAAVPPWNDKDEDGTPDACDAYPNGGGMLFGVDGAKYIAGTSLVPDGMRHAAKLSGVPSTSMIESLPVCHGRCPAWFDAGYRVTLSIRGLTETVRVRIVDEEGSSVAAQGPAADRVLRFHPAGGRRYFLAFAFVERFQPKAQASFEIRYSASDSERRPTRGATSTP